MASIKLGAELDHAVDQLQLRGVIGLLKRTRILAGPGGTSREPEAGSVDTTTGGRRSTPLGCSSFADGDDGGGSMMRRKPSGRSFARAASSIFWTVASPWPESTTFL